MAKYRSQSIRGEEVDFDLLKAKQKIESQEKPDSVKMREKYIDVRRRRNPRRNVADLVDEQRENEKDVREKIKKSREARIQRESEESEKAQTIEDVSDDNTEISTDEQTSTPTETVEENSGPRTSRKKIVRRKSKEHDEY